MLSPARDTVEDMGEEQGTGLSGPWVVIGCGKKKRDAPGPALDLYCSSYITTAARWARSVTPEDRILVLSAKYGLIDSRTVIEPYDVSFRRTRPVAGVGSALEEPPVTARIVGAQAADLGLEGRVITLAGRDYRDVLDRATSGAVEPFNPFADLIRARGHVPGMGRQMQAMNEWTGRIPS